MHMSHHDDKIRYLFKPGGAASQILAGRKMEPLFRRGGFVLVSAIFRRLKGKTLDAQPASDLKSQRFESLRFLHRFSRYRPKKGVLGKGVGNNKNASEMRQKCVKNAPKSVLFNEERSKMRQKYVINASRMRGTPLGENNFWTIPI